MEWYSLEDEGSSSQESTSEGTPQDRGTVGQGEGSGGGDRARYMSTHSLLTLQQLREQNLLCDATVRLDDGTVFRVHRAVLSACSSYFRALFTTTLHSVEVRDAFLPDVTSSAMHGVLEYVYLRTLSLTPWNVCQILLTADYLCIDGAQELCCNYIKDHLVAENCIGVFHFARAFACHGLQTCAFSFILRHFAVVATRSGELLQLSLEDFCLIIGDDLLNIKGEEQVWQCALRWVALDPGARKKCVATLLRHIRLGLLDTEYFLERVKDHEYVVGNDACRPIIIDTLRFLYDLEMIQQKGSCFITPALARPRVPHDILFAIGGWSGGSPTNCIESYDTRADRWIKVEEADPSGPRAYHGTAVLAHQIYVVGGFDGLEYFNSCRCFDAVAKAWREVAPMNGRRCYVSVAILDDVIYALGGYDGHHRQNSAERYNHRENQWTLIAPMHMQRSDASATALNGKIYITGGFNGQECLNSVELYDPVVNQWTLLTPMRSRRSGVSCIAFHGSIYVVGGFNGISRMSSAERYNPSTNQWTPIPDMYHPRSNFAIEVIDDLIFAIGGFNGFTTIDHVECFDEGANEWFEAADMNIIRSALSACVVTDLPNLLDYIHKNRDRLVEEKRLKLIAQERQREDEAQAAALVARAQDVRAGLRVPQIVLPAADRGVNLRPGPLVDRVMQFPLMQLRQQLFENQRNQVPGMMLAVVGVDGQQIALFEPEDLEDDDGQPFDPEEDLEE
ncbi:kelch-like protein 10 [Hetaerina americana]|uniref:kelch-like protein 10 n=1 Tax=Hetaerina americana TaxID=62018 RepID=UPI003A7F4F77